MEIESPADAWYVWVGVAVVSVSVAAVAVGLPTAPPPDAAEAANSVDRVAVAEYDASARCDHAADELRIGTKQIAMRNDGGTSHASVAVGSMTPVFAAQGELREAGMALLAGEEVSRVVSQSEQFETEQELREAYETFRLEVDRDGAEWRPADGPLRIRAVRLGGETVLLVDG